MDFIKWTHERQELERIVKEVILVKFFDKLQEKLLVIADKLNQITYITVIRNSLTLLMPMIIIGAFCTLISNVVCSTTTSGPSLAKISGLSFLENFAPIFTAANYATLNFFAVEVVVLIGIELAKIRKINSTVGGIIAIASYISICVTTKAVTFNDETQIINNVLSSDYTGSKGLFLAMIIGILSVEIFAKLFKSGKLNIHMPNVVPPNIALSFSVLFPAMVTVLCVSTLEFIIQSITGSGLFDLVYTLVQQPLSHIVTGLPGIIILVTISQLFWLLGIHGNQMISAVRDPILTATALANLTAFENGEAIPNIISQGFWYAYMQFGGSGSTLGLIIAIFICSKRDDYKSIAKLSLAPSLFGINETMTFGIPIVLNPVMAIPFILCPIIGAIIGYIATAIGFAGKMMYVIPWTTPPFINGYLASGGNIGVVITQVIILIVCIIVYMPFVIASNKQDLSQAV